MEDYRVGDSPYDESVWRALVTHIHEPWKGTPTDLLRELRTTGMPMLPPSARSLSAAIDRICPWMRGWVFTRPFRGGSQLWVIQPPPAELAARWSEAPAPGTAIPLAPNPPAE